MNRNQRRQIKRAEKKLQQLINSFMEVCYFDKYQLDWNDVSELEYQRIKRLWISFCHNKGFTADIIAGFERNAMLLKTDLILKEMYNIEAPREDVLKLLSKGFYPLDAAKILNNNLNKNSNATN